MNSLQKKILTHGKVLPGNILKVDGFLNHQIDISLLKDMGKDFYTLFKDKNISKILTIEASGIAIACYTAEHFNVPVVFAKKGTHKNVGNDVYTAEVFSYTKGTSYEVAVSKLYLHPEDRVLIIDDFLANGQAVLGLQKIIEDAGATLCGAGIAITKAFQQGEKLLIDAGIDVKSLAAIESMDNGTVVFRED
ncbi:MAG: xanthine phosphoribosyltransferase [Clostridia bacterium]|nr:xanthine phosphoribosyltransferase [Clostridia bacterium]